MNKVLVTGGTGHLGRDVVGLLKARGDLVRVLARTPGQDPDVEWIRGDLSTGAGIPEALAGMHTVVHAATLSPAAQRGYLRMGDFLRSPPEVDIDGTRRLLDESARAGAGHFLHVSIVGVQQSRFPYSRLKAAAEDLVRAGAVPWSIVPATGFYWLLARMLDTMAKRRIWPLPSNLAMQPGDSADFAAYVVECVAEGRTAPGWPPRQPVMSRTTCPPTVKEPHEHCPERDLQDRCDRLEPQSTSALPLTRSLRRARS